ncbi:hypothetical protein HPP92_000776 [Vanilla planifolia]|uniref:Cyclic nucleotide-binding domain-containing protein n=1 Tax=Vanilla planifolia TaxID=51239 RepID=A0A835RYQ7_VANPL|nr:hypothetical protein HPP92_000776 [Vanilla planifolia]
MQTPYASSTVRASAAVFASSRSSTDVSEEIGTKPPGCCPSLRSPRSLKHPSSLPDLRSLWGQEWSRAYLLVCVAGLIVDPLFFYSLSISGPLMCVFIDGWFAITVTVLRCMTDVIHVWNTYLQFKAACCRRRKHHEMDTISEEDSKVGKPQSVVPAPPHDYLKSKKGLILDLFIVLPIMQIMMWAAAPALIRKGLITTVMTVFLITFFLQYLPKVYHFVCFLRRMQNFSGYFFGTIWREIALNLIVYTVASHAVGACWFLLGIQRASKCLKEQCLVFAEAGGCGGQTVACVNTIYYGTTTSAIRNRARVAWANNSNARATCLDSSNNFDYGTYKWTVSLVTNTNQLEKILLPIFWALMNLSTFGNMASTTEWLEIVFCIITITAGVILFTMLIGNIKVFLDAATSKKQALHLRMRSVEWWMKRKNLPQGFRQRVRHYERQRWAAMRGIDESEMIRNLPEGLRRDIKYRLCLDLLRQVPLFQHMDELVLENICDRVKWLIFPKGETITREGDPVQKMIFIVRGHLQSSQMLRDGVKSCCMLGPGNFSGDELLSWCLRRPFVERLPPSSSTLLTLETTEAFALDAADLKYVTQHFRYTFVNEKVNRSGRYYSPGWRTWAAVAIQLAWRRFKHRKTLTTLSFIRPRRPLSRCSSLGEEKLRLYTALLTSPKPNQDDFDSL